MAKKEGENNIRENLKDLSQYTGDILGAAQVAAGLFASSESEAPESNIADQLRALSSEVRKRASYGLDPGQLTIAENNIKSIVENENNLIKDLSGGSVDIALANVASSSKRSHDALSSLMIKDAELKEKKEMNADNMALKAIAADEREYDKNYNKYLANEEAIANMISSGINTMVGENQLRKTNEALKDQSVSSKEMIASLLGLDTQKEETVIKKANEDSAASIVSKNESIDESLQSKQDLINIGKI